MTKPNMGVLLLNQSSTPTVHSLNIDSVPYDAIASGQKSIELRCETADHDSKFSKFKIGDFLIFHDIFRNHQLKTKIIAVEYFSSIDSALSTWGYKNFMPYAASSQEALQRYQQRFGGGTGRLVAIKIEVAK